MIDCDLFDLPHEWYHDGAGNSCYHCNAFEVPDLDDGYDLDDPKSAGWADRAREAHDELPT